MTTTYPTHQPDPDNDRYSNDELRDLLVRVMAAIRRGHPLDEASLARIEAVVRTR